MCGELAAVCDGCGFVVETGNGYLHVSYTDIHEYRRAVAAQGQRLWSITTSVVAWEADHPPTPGLGRVLSGSDLFSHPEPARWRIHHRDCDPEPDSNDYWIGVERIDTWKKLSHWTAHLMGKNWLDSTDWRRLLEGAEYGHGRLAETVEDREGLR